MRTFTPLEHMYLNFLMKRNALNEFKNPTEPLNKPMSVEERKLRSRIRKKCKIYIYELALAQLCGVIPDKEMKKAGLDSIYKALDAASWQLTFEAIKTQKAKK
ncbi:MAG: hypothetical protein DRO67_08120 [Candidatus Asgardarchaeum californiense]|nr:MAG: hypothetical protein DRO67_08120 [Candidatus Asgardarchaeum californiense]